MTCKSNQEIRLLQSTLKRYNCDLKANPVSKTRIVYIFMVENHEEKDP